MAVSALYIDKTVKRVQFIFRSAGMYVKVEDKTHMDKYISRFIYIFNFIWLNLDVIGATVWFFNGVAEHKSLTELTYVAPCVTMSCLSNIKNFSMVINEKAVDELIANIRKLEIEQRERERDEVAEQIMKTENSYLNKVIRALIIFYIILLISFALSPLLLSLLKYYSTNEVELLLPFQVVYPFDPFDMRYYPWVYLRQIWLEILVIIGLSSADFMFYIFCAYLRMQFILLGHYIKNVIPRELKNEHARIEIRNKLVGLIQWHQQIKSCVDLLETLYTRSTLFNFIASSVLICLTGFNVTINYFGHATIVAVSPVFEEWLERRHGALTFRLTQAIDDIAFVLTFLCFLLLSLLQIFFLCFFGDLLMESSMAIGDAVYNSRWYLADRSLGKSMLLILLRSQNPCKLTASKFADVNLKAFMKICSTAWSYFALLQTLYTGPTQ